MRVISILSLCAGFIGCAGSKDDSSVEQVSDKDGDGFGSDVDCDDANAAVHPEAAEIWYDGFDQDCGGDDDFDQDGDGHRAEEFEGDDCVDANAAIAPSLSETPYDGLDNDCNPLTIDDDLDADGFVGNFDCDDSNDQVFPGSLEVIGNGADDDCDGGVDTAPFAMEDFTWSGLSRPHSAFTQTDYGDWLVIAASASSISSPTWVPAGLTSVAALLTLDPLGRGPQPLALEPMFWKGEVDDDVVGMIDLGTRDGQLVAGSTYWNEISRYGWLMIQPLFYGGPGVGWQREAGSFRSSPLKDFSWVDLSFDAQGMAWLCGSDGNAVGYLRADDVFPASGGDAPGDGTRGCLLNPIPSTSSFVQFTTLDGSGAPLTWRGEPFAPDPDPVPSLEQPYEGERWTSVRERDGIITAIPRDTGGLLLLQGETRTLLLEDLSILEGEVAIASDGSLWIAAVADEGGSNELLLAHGAADALEILWFSDPGPDLSPVAATVAVTDERVLLAFTARGMASPETEALGWVLLGR